VVFQWFSGGLSGKLFVCRVHLGMGGLNQTKGSPWSEEVHFRVGSVFRVHLRVRKAKSNQGFTLE
jgi:hypothetical protein